MEPLITNNFDNKRLTKMTIDYALLLIVTSFFALTSAFIGSLTFEDFRYMDVRNNN